MNEDTTKTDAPVVKIAYEEPKIGNVPTDVNLEEIFGNLPMVTTTPTWVPMRFRDGIAMDTTTHRIWYYDFTHNVWKTIGGATSVLGTTGAVSLDPSLGSVFTITPTAAVQVTPSSFPSGAFMVVRVLTSGTTSYVIDFQTGFVTTATLSTGTLSGRYFTIAFICDGTYWIEISRTTAMLPF